MGDTNDLALNQNNLIYYLLCIQDNKLLVGHVLALIKNSLYFPSTLFFVASIGNWLYI